MSGQKKDAVNLRKQATDPPPWIRAVVLKLIPGSISDIYLLKLLTSIIFK